MKEEKIESFDDCVRDLLQNDRVGQLKHITQHAGINCLDHSLFVSYVSYRICCRLGLDYRAAARGGLLHDLFLYDWKEKYNSCSKHLVKHPAHALKNATAICKLTKKEKDIIQKHMWPLTLTPPKYVESYIVNLVDTLCATAEILHIYKLMRVGKKIKAYC